MVPSGQDEPAGADGSAGGGGLDAVVAHLRAAVPVHRRALVAVDGVGASGKSTVTAELARRLGGRPVVVLHADDFFHPSSVRHARGRLSPEGFWLDAYDYAALTSWALDPLRPSGDGLYRASSHDPASDRTVRPDARQAPADAVVLVEGTFLHRDELVGYWDFSLYLDVALEESERRMAVRDGVDPDARRGLAARYAGAQRLYFAAASPWDSASLVLDTTDLDRPRVVDPSEVAARR